MAWDTADTDSVQSVDILKRTEIKAEPSTLQSNGTVRLHEFVSKTVCYLYQTDNLFTELLLLFFLFVFKTTYAS